jgi:hypothetical protein
LVTCGGLPHAHRSSKLHTATNLQSSNAQHACFWVIEMPLELHLVRGSESAQIARGIHNGCACGGGTGTLAIGHVSGNISALVSTLIAARDSQLHNCVQDHGSLIHHSAPVLAAEVCLNRPQKLLTVKAQLLTSHGKQHHHSCSHHTQGYARHPQPTQIDAQALCLADMARGHLAAPYLGT